MFNFNPFKKIETAPGPEIRVVGKKPAETKEKIKKEIFGYFGEKHLESLPEESRKEILTLEYPKTPEELELIAFANKKTNELMIKAGVKPYDIPTNNIHIIPPDLYRKALDGTNTSDATTFYTLQMIVFNAEVVRNNKHAFGILNFHEQMHLKGHAAFEIETKKDDKGNEETKPVEFREGLTVQSSLKKEEQKLYHSHFRGLHEAIVSYEEREFAKEMLELPIFKEEKKWLESTEAGELKNKITKDKKISSENVLWVSRDGKKWNASGYLKHQKVLSFLLEEMRKEFSDKYKTTDDAYTEFLKSQFTGSLLNIARPIEKTFGKGSFEVLGMMTSEAKSAVQMLEYLRRARTRQLKKEKQTHGS